MDSKIKVTYENCGNSPKINLIFNYLVAIVNKNVEELKEIVSKDIEWEEIGKEKIIGIENFIFEDMISNQEIIEVKIPSAISHGKEGASITEVYKKDGKKITLGDFYKFKTFKGKTVISEVRTFVSEKDIK